MLTREENHWNIQLLKLLSFLNFLPIKYNRDTGQFHLQRLTWKIYTCKVFLTCAIFHWIQMGGRFLYEKRNGNLNSSMEKVIIAYLLMSFPFLGVFLYWLVLFKNLVPSIIVLNRIVAQSGSDKLTRPIWSIFKHSIQELMVRVCPVLFVGTTAVFSVVLGTDLAKNHQLYACLPDSMKSTWTYWALLGYEVFILSFSICGGTIFGLIVLEFQLKFREELENIKCQMRKLKSMTIIPNQDENSNDDEQYTVIQTTRKQIFEEIRELSIFIQLFNEAFAFPNFSTKSYCISLFVLSSFFTIQNFQDHPFLSCFTFYLAGLCTLFYKVAYEKAFFISRDFEDMKRNLLCTRLLDRHENENMNQEDEQQLELQDLETEPETETQAKQKQQRAQEIQKKQGRADQAREFQRQVECVQRAAIKVGSFHVIERESTLIFINYSIDKLVTLLMAFPK